MTNEDGFYQVSRKNIGLKDKLRKSACPAPASFKYDGRGLMHQNQMSLESARLLGVLAMRTKDNLAPAPYNSNAPIQGYWADGRMRSLTRFEYKLCSCPFLIVSASWCN